MVSIDASILDRHDDGILDRLDGILDFNDVTKTRLDHEHADILKVKLESPCSKHSSSLACSPPHCRQTGKERSHSGWRKSSRKGVSNC